LCLLRGRNGGEHLRADIRTGVEGEGVKIMQLIAEYSALIAVGTGRDWHSVWPCNVACVEFRYSRI
jgi:hypothetical protein